MTKVQKERNLKLAEALRSGKYKQGKYRLRDSGGGFCCLGVACDLVKDEIGGEWSPTYTKFIFHDEHFGGLPPLEVQEHYGWKDCDPKLPSLDGDQEHASVRNDRGERFESIAAGFERLVNESPLTVE